jgi:hypothetical protein
LVIEFNWTCSISAKRLQGGIREKTEEKEKRGGGRGEGWVRIGTQICSAWQYNNNFKVSQSITGTPIFLQNCSDFRRKRCGLLLLLLRRRLRGRSWGRKWLGRRARRDWGSDAWRLLFAKLVPVLVLLQPVVLFVIRNVWLRVIVSTTVVTIIIIIIVTASFELLFSWLLSLSASILLMQTNH